MDSWIEHEVVGHNHDSEMKPRQYEVSSPDICLCFLELCIRMQTSTSWMIHSVQWMQESADTCSNSEFAPVFLSSLLSRNPVEIREESSGKPLCFRRLSSFCPGVPLLVSSFHRRSIIEKSCIFMKSRKDNTAGASILWRPVGSVL